MHLTSRFSLVLGVLASPLTAVRATGQVPEATLRRADAVADHEFGILMDLHELGDGRVLVTDWIEEAVLAVDFETGSVERVGRRGAGPREYRLPSRLLNWRGDSLLLVDTGNNRLDVISPSLVLERSVLPGAGPGSANPRGADDRGRLYYAVPRWARGSGGSDSIPVMLLDLDSGRQVELARVLTYRPPAPLSAPSRIPRIPLVIFGPQDSWVVSPEGRIAIVRAGDYSVEWVSEARRVRGPSYAFDRRRVSEEDKVEFIRRFNSRSPMSGRGEDGGMGHTPSDFNSPAAIRRSLEVNEFAEVMPYFDPAGVYLDGDQRLWVKRLEHRGAERYDIFDRQGAMVLRITLPEGRELVGVGKLTAYAVVSDEFDIQTLERYRVEWPDGQSGR